VGNTVFSVHGGDGGDGGSHYAGDGGDGGDAGFNTFDATGGDGGNGGRGASHGDGGHGARGVAILVSGSADILNNVVYGVYGGTGGDGMLYSSHTPGDGGDGGNGSVGSTAGYDSGDGGDGGDGGDAGRGGDAAEGLGIVTEGSSAAPRIVNNTVDRLDRGAAGMASDIGNGGSGGDGATDPTGDSDGTDGQAGAPGSPAVDGAESGTVGLHASDGAAPDVYNNVIVRTVYTDTNDYFVGTFTDSVGISGTTIANLDYNNVWGWQTNYAGVSKGPNDVSADPRFTDILCMDCEDFSLFPASPCIDAASNAQAPLDDHDNVLRPQDGNLDGSAIADIGAYEYLTDTTFAIPCDASGVYTTPDDLLTFDWDSGLCTTCTITTTYTPLAYPPGPTGDLDFGNVAFAVDAVDCYGDAVSIFSPTLGLNFNYGTHPPTGMDEATMGIYQWHPLIWTWASLPAQSRDEASDTLTVTLAYPGEFALLGNVSGSTVYLPLILRSSGD
jgi:hypothetical protein